MSGTATAIKNSSVKPFGSYDGDCSDVHVMRGIC